jgi:hypothetical protein
VAEANRTLDVQTLTVGPAMTERVRHPAQPDVIDRCCRIALKDSANSAHEFE